MALALALTACAGPQTSRLLTSASDLPLRAEVGGVPYYAQEDFYCGPAALAMVATWAGGAPLTQAEAAALVYTPHKQGSFREDMVAAARRAGLRAVPVRDLRSLLDELAAGHPVLVFQNLGLDWVPAWHYSVAIGYERDRRALQLRSGPFERLVTDMSVFEHTWRRGDYWALVVLPPGRLPAKTNERDVLEAALGLERAGNAEAAALAYASATQRWPESHGAWFALGNARYDAGDFAGAAVSFERATMLKPDDPDAWNNLAYALVEAGRPGEARQAAERAVRLAPAGAEEPYRATLQEIHLLTARVAG
ncbi:MAG: PA2778 family cysteine peptidase [Actinobacteria bacterium]|nr:PA2778 family cysteine peptidase [Actinomycetota bacterium]